MDLSKIVSKCKQMLSADCRRNVSIRKVAALIQRRTDFPVVFVGDNWNSDEDKPIAILFGFAPWKRQVVSAYLREYRTAFVVGNASFRRVKRSFLSELSEDQKFVFVGWGRKLPWQVNVYIASRKAFARKVIDNFTVEDGFLRSMGAGLLHTRPASLCVDGKGIYFDANSPSDLETILNEHDFSKEPELMARAAKALELMRAARLTKYYDLRPYAAAFSFKRSARYSILVIGQVEDDASVLNGKSSIRSNVELVLQARRDFPEADIYFRPHPDYWSGNRKPRSKISKLKDVCALVPPETSLYELFAVVDHVYTMTSLAGFEALVHGLKVTTFGAPFYSNWGLTDDRVKVTRRTRTLSLEELFAGAYLLYPRYLHVMSDEFVGFEDIASYFIVEGLKHGDIFELHRTETLFAKCLPFRDMLSVPFQILAYLNETRTFSAGKTDELLDVVRSNFRLADYPQISFLLTVTANYDALVEYSNLCIAYVAEKIGDIITNTRLLENFLYSLSLALANANGRVIDKLPNINPSLTRLSANDDNFNGIVRNYVKCLSSNLQYDVIDDLLQRIGQIAAAAERERSFNIHWSMGDVIKDALSFKVSDGHYRSICQVLMQKPARSERNFAKRHQLTLQTAAKYVGELDAKYDSGRDTLLNRIQYWSLLGNDTELVQQFRQFAELVGWTSADSVRPLKALGLAKRNSEMLGLGHLFVKKGHFELAELIMAAVPPLAEDLQYVTLKLSYFKKKRDRAGFFEYYESLPPEIRNDDKVVGIHARLLREMGLFERARLRYDELAKQSRTLAKKVSVELEIRKIEFIQESSRILNSIPQPTLPRGVIFLASQTCFNTLAMMVPSLVELKKKGYAVVNLTEGMTEHQPTGIAFIDRLSGIIPLDLAFTDLRNEWEIDWPRRSVRANGINFYQGFYETLSVYSRRYHVDINVPQINRAFREKLARADTCLYVCKLVFEEVVGRGVPVSFVSGNSHVTPFSVFRDFARSKSHPLLNFINCNVAYESYFSNLGSKFANTMCVTDMTLHPNIRAPFMARQDQFERWYAKNETDPAFVEKARALINVNRVGSTSNARETEIITFIKEQKALGKRIVCAFGKVPVDLNVPYDGGPAHDDMADWINHTVEVCGESKDIVLLVKPHPHELRPEIALDLVESFHDLIIVDIQQNVILLGHKDINGHALAPYLDLAILYNGSSGLELTAQGIPVIMTSHFGRYDYPVELNYPQSRAQYREFLLSTTYPVPSEEVRKRAAFLMCYLGTDEISILNQYSLRQLTNDKIGVPRWRKEKVKEFLETGDRKMALVANRIVEKFECALSDEREVQSDVTEMVGEPELVESRKTGASRQNKACSFA